MSTVGTPYITWGYSRHVKEIQQFGLLRGGGGQHKGRNCVFFFYLNATRRIRTKTQQKHDATNVHSGIVTFAEVLT